MVNGLTESEYSIWTWKSVSAPWEIVDLTIPPEQIPKPPSRAELESHLNDNQAWDKCVGAFVNAALEKGFKLTVEQAFIGVERTELVRTYRTGYLAPTIAVYRTHVWGGIRFKSDPSPWHSPIAPAIVWAVAIGIGIFLAALGVGAYFALRNLTETSNKTTQHTVLTNPTSEPVVYTLPDGTTVTVPPGGTYDVTGTTENTGSILTNPWLLIVIAIIAIVGLALLFFVGQFQAKGPGGVTVVTGARGRGKR